MGLGESWGESHSFCRSSSLQSLPVLENRCDAPPWSTITQTRCFCAVHVRQSMVDSLRPACRNHFMSETFTLISCKIKVHRLASLRAANYSEVTHSSQLVSWGKSKCYCLAFVVVWCLFALSCNHGLSQKRIWPTTPVQNGTMKGIRVSDKNDSKWRHSKFPFTASEVGPVSHLMWTVRDFCKWIQISTQPLGRMESQGAVSLPP